jgi:hypothetical protein
MNEKKSLKIEMDFLCSAMEQSSYDSITYLDMETGEQLYFSDYGDNEINGISKDEIEEDEERYQPVPKMDSDEAWQLMEDFIDTLDNERLARLLEKSIRGRGAFRRFKDVLLDYPEEEARWFKYRDGRVKELVREWLDEIGVTPIEK